MTNANVEKKKQKETKPKTQIIHWSKQLQKKWNKRPGMKEFIQNLYWHMGQDVPALYSNTRQRTW